MPEFLQLIEDARTGSDDAIGRLIESLRTYLLLVANQELEPQLRQKVAASDFVQDACLVAAESFSSFRGTSEAEFRGWLRRVLLNSMADSRRKYVQSQKRQANREVTMDEGIGVPAAQITPQTDMIAREESKQLKAAMHQLPEDYRIVLQLRNWELLPFDEIGQRMDRSADAAQKLWTRAIRQLEKELN